MQLRVLGDTGIAVSPLGLGTVKFGRTVRVKYPTAFNLPSDDAVRDLLALAQDLGINTLDTAPAYGTSEARLGALVENRADWVIIGKAGEECDADGQSHYDFTPAALERSLLRSLTRLQTDYLDVLLLHSDGRDLENLHDDVIAKMLEFKARGLVRAVGASTKTVAGGLRSLQAMDVVMACYNSSYLDERPVLDEALRLGKGVLLKKAMGSGHLPAAEALRFALSHPAVSSAIIGTINPDHLRANLQAVAALNAPA